MQLARAAGIDRTTIDKWKHQPRPPHPPTVKQAAEGLGIPMPEAMELAGVLPGPEPSPGPAPQEQQKEDAPDETDVRDAHDRVVQAMQRDPELALAFAELLARVRGAPPPAARTDIAHSDVDVSCSDEEGGAA